MMLKSAQAVCIVLLLAAQQNAAAVGNVPEVLLHPSSKILPERTNAIFRCILRGTESRSQWLINGQYITNMQAFTDMGFVFQTQQINTTEMLLNMSLIVPASADNNNTVFSCIAGTDTVKQRTESKPATLTVYEESPVVPNPMITAHNETFLSLRWSPVFLWPGISPLEYNIIVADIANGAVFQNTSVDTNFSMIYISTFIIDIRELNGKPETCSILNFMITPIGPGLNGDEKASVNGRYPTEPRDYEVSILNSTVYFYQNATPAYVLLCIQLPYVCNNQEVNYTITVTLTEEALNGSLYRTASGPAQHQQSKNVVCKIVSGLKKETNYSAEAIVETETGNITSHKHFFNTKFMTGGNGATTIACNDQLIVYRIAMSVSVGIAILLIILMTIFSVCMCKRHTKYAAAKNKTKAAKKVLVHNPIYDGPIYDTIHQGFGIPLHAHVPPKAMAHTDKSNTPRYLNDVINTDNQSPFSTASSSAIHDTKNQQNAAERIQETPSSADQDAAASFKFGENLPGVSELRGPEVGYTVMHPVGKISSSLNGGWGELSTSFKHHE